MISRARYYTLILVTLCAILWAACTQDRQPCLTPKIASLNIECMHKTNDTATVYTDTALPQTMLVVFTNTVAQRYIYPNQTADFTISLSSIADSCRWGITTDTLNFTNMDTLTFFYKRQLQFLSNACGFTDFYSLDSVHSTRHMIDSFLITNTSVNNNVNTKHLQVYIHPDY
jgi:hypothetical protein